MIQITKQQADKRWDVMTVNLREILYSPDYGKIIWNICEANHLSDEKIGKIAGLCGYVIMGFIYPEDLAKEIFLKTNINSEIANSIASEINRKIFSPIKSDLEKVYSPIEVSAEDGASAIEGEAEAEESRDEIASSLARNDGKDETEPISIPVEIRKPEPPIKIIGLEEDKKEIQSMDSALPYREAPAENIQFQKEKETAAIDKEPLIIHEEIELKPLSETKKSFKSLGGLFGFLKKKGEIEKKKEENLARAEVEGGGFFKKVIKEIKPIETKIKVVDYSEVPETTNNQQQTTDNLQHTEPPIKIIGMGEEIKPKTNDKQPATDNEQKLETRINENEAEPPIKIKEAPLSKEKKSIEAPKIISEEEKGFLKDEIETFPYGEAPMPVSENLKISTDEKIQSKEIELPEEVQLPKVEIKIESEQGPKKKLFSKLSDFFKRKTKTEIETKKEAIAEPEIEKN